MAVHALLCTLLLQSPPLPATAPELLQRLTLEEKAGQLFMPWILSRAAGQDAARAAARELVREVGVGGYILSLGSAAEAVALAAALQEEAKVPLLLAGDFEAGVGYRFTGATRLGYPMLLGAAGSAHLAEAQGRVTAAEARALGFHVAFAPVLDVNVNPRNPIINVRSFAEDPAAVARLGVAMIRGMEQAGLLATGKHFPGHGDVSTDSHLLLPVVPAERSRLDAVELLPFRAAVRSPLSCLMTGHLSVPGLGEDPAVSATLSPRILTDLVRKDLRFQGLLVTDALDMGAITKSMSAGEAAVRALLAGADVLLMSPDPRAARAALVAAVQDGRVPRARLDEAVARLLAAKERVGLLAGRGGPAPDWPQVLAVPLHGALAEEIATRGLTLVRDTAGLLPLPATARPLVVTVLDEPSATTGMEFARGLGTAAQHLRLHPGSAPAEVAAAVAAIAAAELPIGAFHVQVQSFVERIGIPDALLPVAKALGSHARGVAVSFGSPYLLTDMPEVPLYLCAYDSSEHTERAAARALRGAAAVTGRLPVTIPDLAARGAGASFWPMGRRADTKPEHEGLLPDLPEQLRLLLERGVAAQAFPGAVALVSRRGRVVAEVAVGRETYSAGSPAVRVDTRFDLASLTKVCATLPVLMELLAHGKLRLDQHVAELVPAFTGGRKPEVTLRQLAAHAAGLPPFRDYFRWLGGRDAIVAAAAAEPLASAPGERTVYSDLGLILLMACAEQAAAQPFEQQAREVWQRIGAGSATFSRSGQPIAAAPTEDCRWRRRVVQGEVHDENAFAMGGVSGHAGMFGTARDVAAVGHLFLGSGRGLWRAPLVRGATQRLEVVAGSSRALLWDTFVSGGPGGTLLSPGSFGHTGFTGTSIWCDPGRDLCLVLLTNRVHPSRQNRTIEGFRRELADLVVRSLDAGAAEGRQR